MRTRPQDVGPNVRANVDEGLRYTAIDVAHAQSLQTVLYRRWQDFFRDWDVILTPSITISPRPWRELYPTEIDGRKIFVAASMIAADDTLLSEATGLMVRLLPHQP